MNATLHRTPALGGILALAAVLAAGPQLGPASAQEQEAAITVQLSPTNDSGITGTARIYEGERHGHGEMMREEKPETEGEKPKEGQERERMQREGMKGHEMMGEMSHAHRVVLALDGLREGRTYPAHIHRGTCAEGGPVLIPLESVQADASGAGSSTTSISARQIREAMQEMMGEREGMMREGMEGRAMMGERGHMKHPPVFIMAHLPDGTPAACGDVPMHDEEKEGAEGY